MAIQPDPTKLTRQRLQSLARLRLREAEALYKAKLYDGCVYLAGYAIELALKARICTLLKLSEYPETGELGKACKLHKLDQLKVLAGLSQEIDSTRNPGLFANWSVATKWNPEQRYEAPGQYDKNKAKDILR
jgi:HEPN domain-containing protein